MSEQATVKHLVGHLHYLLRLFSRQQLRYCFEERTCPFTLGRENKKQPYDQSPHPQTVKNFSKRSKNNSQSKKNDRQQRQWVHLATVHKELLKLETPKGSRSLELQVCNCASSRQAPNQAALIRSRLFRIHSAAHVNWQRLVNCIVAATPLFKDPNANKILPEARGLIIAF